MKAYIVHLFTVCGGGERVSLEIASVLHSLGFDVVFVTNTVSGLRKCAELFNLPCEYEVEEVSSLTERILGLTGRFVRYRRLVLILKALEVTSDRKPGDLLVDTASNGSFNVDIAYIHYPVLLGTVQSGAIYWKLYNWLVARKATLSAGKPRLALANSHWTARLVKELYGIEAEVIHPPVDAEYYEYDGRPKEKVIVTISRFTPEKNLHLLPRIALKLPDYDWYLVGTTGSTRSEKTVSNRVLKRVLREVEKWRARNFHVFTDLSRRNLRELLQRANFYIHPPFPEHFGIAVVEAMAAGAIPIVYRDGGAWTDLVSRVSPELGYAEIEEVPSKVRSLESSNKLEEMRKTAVVYSREFSPKAFREKLSKIITDYLEKSRR